MSGIASEAAPSVHGPRSRAFHDKVQAERIPLSGGIELTHRCNLACVHCYVNLAPNDREAQRRELTTDEWCRVIDQLVDAGTLWLTLTGGEPLLRPDFCEIYRYAHQRGMVLTVYTNATMITEKHLELWTEHPPRMVEVTQYGYTRETYDRVTDAGENFDRFHRGLERVRALGAAVALKTMAMRATKDEVHEIRRFAEREGLGFRFDAVISPRIDGGRGPLAQRLSPAELADIEHADESRNSALFTHCVTEQSAQRDDRLYQCGAGLLSFTIDPYGKLHVCELSRRPGWDVLRDGFAEGMRVGVTGVITQKRQDMSGCGSCATQSSCSNCVGMAELERKSLDFGDPYFCQVTDERNARMFGDARQLPQGLVRLRLRGEHG